MDREIAALVLHPARRRVSTTGDCEPGRGRIVAETFHRAIQGSKKPSLYYRPTLGPNNTTFRLIDLLMVTYSGQAAQANPSGS